MLRENNTRACAKRLINANETKRGLSGSREFRSIVSAYPNGY